MFSQTTYPRDVLPFTPLPDNAFDAAYDSMLNLGFVREAILEMYRYTGQSGAFTLNALAFSDSRRRTPDEFAAITFYNAANGMPDDQIVAILAQTSAPFHLIHRDNRFTFWASPVQKAQVQPLVVVPGIAYDQLASVLATYAVDLAPARLVDVKQGRAEFSHPFLRRIELRQLALWAFDITHNLLVQHFGDAVVILRKHLADQHLEAMQCEAIVVDLAIQLLGAVILADTGVLGNDIRCREQKLTLDDLIQASYSQHPGYFKPDLFAHYADAATQAFQVLRRIRYAGFVPDMLSHLYTTAYPPQERKKLGRFDTPLYLTRRIWDALPVEFLRPEQRITVDMTCGWGSFLIAGYDRLSQMSDMRGRQLRDYIHGNDYDRFTARLAGLGLLLSTSTDSWHIDDQDALTWHWLDTHKPGIIVGNPPFGGDRKTRREDTALPRADRKRHQEADQYLEHALEHLASGGYLAMLMPLSFIAAESSPQLRKKLLETCDILEIWELPFEAFPDATVSTMVIFAQKKETVSRSHQPVRVRTVQKYTLDHFVHDGLFTASSVASDQYNWNETPRKSQQSRNTHIIDYRLILPEFIWGKIHLNSKRLLEEATVFSGAIEGKSSSRKRWKDYPYPKRVPWLTGARDVITRPFVIAYDQASTICYPNDLEKPRKDRRHAEKDKEHLLAGTKVLLVSDPNPSWGKRVKVAIERRGYYVSHSFWVIVPRLVQSSAVTYEVLAAILNWYVSNAWIVEHLMYPWVGKRAIQTIPFPHHLSEADCEALTAAVQELEHAAQNNVPLPAVAQDRIDTILKAAYQLDDATFDRLRIISEWDQHPRVTLDPQPDRVQADFLTSGVVEQVDAKQGTITLWISGFEDLQTVPIDPLMPGWMLRPEAAFCARIPYACERSHSLDAVIWNHITPQQYTYLSEEKLVENLTDVFYPDRSR